MESLDLSALILSIAGILPDWALAILIFIGTLHFAIPPIQAAVEAVIRLTPSKKDDEKYEEIIRSKGYLIAIKVIAYISGLKLKEKKKVKVEE